MRRAGFLSLEEIDETEYGLNIPEPAVDRKKKKEKAKQSDNVKKQQLDGVDGASSDADEAELDESVKSKEKKKKKKKKKKKGAGEDEKVEQSDAGNCLFGFELSN